MAYLTVAQYVTRFGERETIIVTNTTALSPGTTPTIDSARVQAAISDAEEVIESYIGKRYRTPLTNPPKLLIGWAATLAREDLHTKTAKMVPAVQEAADRVRSQLRDVAKGIMELPLEDGQQAPEQQGQGYARSSNDRAAPVFSTGALDGYTAPFTGGYAPAAWRG